MRSPRLQPKGTVRVNCLVQELNTIKVELEKFHVLTLNTAPSSRDRMPTCLITFINYYDAHESARLIHSLTVEVSCH